MPRSKSSKGGGEKLVDQLIVFPCSAFKTNSLLCAEISLFTEAGKFLPNRWIQSDEFS